MITADRFIPKILKHEGGFVDHPNDPGGATNRGVTIGTLKRLGIDIDGDGDSDIKDLRLLPESEAVRVYKLFYWDKVSADLLPLGVDYATADYAVNSGPSRAAKALQTILGVVADGDIGPKTIAAANLADPKTVVGKLCDQRLAFMKRLKIWPTFKNGWTIRVDSVRRDALLAISAASDTAPARDITRVTQSPLAALITAILSLFGAKK